MNNTIITITLITFYVALPTGHSVTAPVEFRDSHFQINNRGTPFPRPFVPSLVGSCKNLRVFSAEQLQ